MEEESTFLNSKSHFINANLHFMTRYAMSLVNFLRSTMLNS